MRRPGRVPAVIGSVFPLLWALALGACGGSSGGDPRTEVASRPATTEPWSPFCAEAIGFVEEFGRRQGELSDPAAAPGFLADAQVRLTELDPPEEAAEEVAALIALYREIDGVLAAVGYDVASVDPDEVLAAVDTDAARGFDAYLLTSCGVGSEEPSESGPPILDPDELASLLDGDRGDDASIPPEVREQLATDLAAVSGLSMVETRCVIDRLPVEVIDRLLDSGDVDDTTAGAFQEVLVGCTDG